MKPVISKAMLAGKVALITGASCGIGAETAVLFARLGSQVALTARGEANLLQTAAECERQPAAKKPFVVVADLTKEEDVRRVIDSTVKHFGRLDILVNSAGVGDASSLTCAMESYDRVMNINLRSIFHLTSLAIPHLIKSKGASIVNVSSIYSTAAMKNRVVYSMTKAALDQYTRSAALDLAEHRVRVNSVNPGLVQTEIQRRMGMSEQRLKEIAKRSEVIYPLGRCCEKIEVARAIAFLASDDASFITGVHLRVDGGYRIQSVI